jgi:hypothetical protein
LHSRPFHETLLIDRVTGCRRWFYRELRRELDHDCGNDNRSAMDE